MKNLKNFKTFESEQSGPPMPVTTEETITNYYKCLKCGYFFRVFNETSEACPNCRNYELSQISSFDYFTELRKGDKETFTKELRLQHKRENNIIDLLALGAYKNIQNYKKSLN
jgi:hypothetical protein